MYVVNFVRQYWSLLRENVSHNIFQCWMTFHGSRLAIILHNYSHGGIIRVCMRIFTTALRNKTIRHILNKNTSPYFHCVSLVIWPLTLMKRTHFSELSISRFSIYIRRVFLMYCYCAKWSSHSWSLVKNLIRTFVLIENQWGVRY